MAPTRPPSHSPFSGGFTLLELMVAIGVFVLLAVILVGLLQSGLNTWDVGTSRKDVYERAQAVFSLLTRDLQAFFTVDPERAEDPFYPMLGDYDAAGRQRLRFVRTEGGASPLLARPRGRSRGTSGGSGGIDLNDPRLWEPPLLEVAWAPDPDPAQAVLWRAERTWSWPVNEADTFFNDARFDNRAFFQNAKGEHIDKGVLYWELRYWTRNTGAWNGPRPRGGTTSRIAGPEWIWDSTRGHFEGFAFYKPLAKDLPKDPVYPEMIRVTVVLEPQVGERMSTVLAAPLDDKSRDIQVASTRGFLPPDAGLPAFARVGKEWVQYHQMAGGVLMATRGVRGTKAQAHPAGTPVRTGLTFTTVVAIPMFREGKY